MKNPLFLEAILEFPKQGRETVRLARGMALPRSYTRSNKIVFLGMGGSAVGAQCIQDYLKCKIKLPVFIVRDWRLPTYVDERSLVFAISYSGSTAETLSAYRQSLSAGAKTIAISSGGKLEAIALRQKQPFVKIPACLAARCALGYLSLTPLQILARVGVIADHSRQIKSTFAFLERWSRSHLYPQVSVRRNLAKLIARQLCGRFVFIYGGEGASQAAVLRWRSQIAENAKQLASSFYFPEALHNEIVGWERPRPMLRKSTVVFLKDPAGQGRVGAGMELCGAFMRKEGARIVWVEPHGQDLFTRIFSLIIMGDFTSYYLAGLNRVDPLSIKRIEYIKAKLGGC